MQTIWKYRLTPGNPTRIEMPVGARVLCVQTQGDEPHLWALVTRDGETETRTFAVYGTGHILPVEPGNYLGTFQMQGGALVFHLFETLPDPA